MLAGATPSGSGSRMHAREAARKWDLLTLDRRLQGHESIGDSIMFGGSTRHTTK